MEAAAGTSAGFWLGGVNALLPPEAKKIFFGYETVHSEVYLNKYVVSIAPFSRPTPACPDCSQNIT